jgi:hypothetical protein
VSNIGNKKCLLSKSGGNRWLFLTNKAGDNVILMVLPSAADMGCANPSHCAQRSRRETGLYPSAYRQPR